MKNNQICQFQTALLLSKGTFSQNRWETSHPRTSARTRWATSPPRSTCRTRSTMSTHRSQISTRWKSFPKLCLFKKVFLFPDERLVLILYRSWGARRFSSRFLPFHYLDILYGYTFQLGLLMKIKIIIIILYWVAITKDFQLGFIFLWKFGVKFYPLSLSRTRFGWSFKYFLKLFTR